MELPKAELTLERKKRVPRIVVEISEGGANLVRCPAGMDIDIEIQDYDVPDEWDPENTGEVNPELETGIKKDVFGRRFQFIKFKRRSKKKS